ncbi:MAG: hypothetical protein HYY80_00610 [Chloroflexi bacterium]|nr:hypothetical protein [Chloroflexota bacterium]
MDFSNISENLPVIVMIVGLILLQFFLKRRRKPEITRQEITQDLLSEVRLNQALLATFGLRQKPKKFETVSWQINKSKLDFLDESLQAALSQTFMMVADANQQIGAAKKYKSTSYMVSIDMGKLKNSLAKSREGLEEWLQSTTGTKDPSPQTPDIIDSLLGRR